MTTSREAFFASFYSSGDGDSARLSNMAKVTQAATPELGLGRHQVCVWVARLLRLHSSVGSGVPTFAAHTIVSKVPLKPLLNSCVSAAWGKTRLAEHGDSRERGREARPVRRRGRGDVGGLHLMCQKHGG